MTPACRSSSIDTELPWALRARVMTQPRLAEMKRWRASRPAWIASRTCSSPSPSPAATVAEAARRPARMAIASVRSSAADSSPTRVISVA